MDPNAIQNALQREQALRAQLEASRREALSYQQQLASTRQGGRQSAPYEQDHQEYYQEDLEYEQDPYYEQGGHQEDYYEQPQDQYYEQGYHEGREYPGDQGHQERRGRRRVRSSVREARRGYPSGRRGRRPRSFAGRERSDPLAAALESERARSRDAARELRQSRTEISLLRDELSALRESVLSRGFALPPSSTTHYRGMWLGSLPGGRMSWGGKDVWQ